MLASSSAIAGTGTPTNQSAPAPGSAFGVPLYSTQPRFVPDAGNSSLGIAQAASTPVPLNTTRLDQLDIVRGMKLLLKIEDTWTAGGSETLTASPFYPANIISSIQFQLQAAYNNFRLPGFLAAAMQAYRPMWGDRGLGASTPNTFAQLGQTPNLAGTANDLTFLIDIPFAIKLDEYFDLSADGVPVNRYGESIVGVQYMAAQSRVVVPTINFASGFATSDLLNAPVSKASADATSTFTGTVTGQLARDAWWTGQNPASNPPEFPWIYTRDYFVQPVSGQASNALIQNTGVSVGQVLSLCCVTWDPTLNGNKGGPVPLSDIETFTLVTGGSLDNIGPIDPAYVEDKMRSLYGNATATNLIDAGIFVFDFCLSECGSYLSNANAINTYVVNGVQLSCNFKTSYTPGSNTQTYIGVEALKMATS